MSQAGTGVLVAVAVGRNTWVSKQATLHYESSRLVKAEGIDFPAGPNGVSGILYVVKDCLCRDNRRLMRVERHKIVDGKVVDVQNWGEVEDAGPSSALAPETSTGAFSPPPHFPENTVFQAVPACLAG